MKTKMLYKFNLPEEQKELDILISNNKLYSLYWDLMNYHRQLYKYDEREQIPMDEVIAKIECLIDESVGDWNL